MHLSKKSEYALRALLYMAKRPAQTIHTIQDISQTEKIPTKFLEQILPVLKQSGYITSKRGLKGGHSLLRSPEQIYALDIITLMENMLLAPDTPSGGESDAAVNIFLRELSAKIARSLGTHSITDLLQNAHSMGSASFEI